MQENFKECVDFVLEHEGGYVWHKDDPGGETNWGITRRTAEWALGHPVDMKTLTRETAEKIYEMKYWGQFADLPAGLDLCAFDFGVNAGPRRAQRIIDRMPLLPSLALSIEWFCDQRLDYYKGLKHFDTFGRGWTRRTEECCKKALEMAARKS